MVNTKLNEEKSAIIVRRVSVAATLRNVPKGTEIHFKRNELGNRDNTVMSAVARLNHAAGAQEYTLRIDDNDGSYWIKRK